jgi:ribosomal protein L20
MPRSVNSVASRERRKKLMKHAKGYFGRRKNVWTVAKNAVEKVSRMLTATVRTKNAHSALYGFSVLTLVLVCTECLTHNSWVR